MSEQEVRKAIEWLEKEKYYIGSRLGETIQTQVFSLSIQALQAELSRIKKEEK